MATERGFPLDDYTPNGYLANPAHTWKLSPSGVIRSVAPVGFGWYFPNYPGRYNNKWIYAAALRVGLRAGDRRPLLPAGFGDDGPLLTAPYHSSKLFRFEWAFDGIIASATFTRVHDDVIGCTLRLLNTGPARRVELLARLDYARNVERSLLWEHDLFSRQEAGVPVLGVYPEGDAIALGALSEADHCRDVDFDLPGLPDPLAGPGSPVPQLAIEADWTVDLPAGTAVAFPLALARQGSAEAAAGLAQAAAKDVRFAEREAVQDDNRFWNDAPQLQGDWPEHWRRGVVYDLESLRLCVRPPSGIFRGPWDAMQQQVPRLVLAEAALDAVLLGYADPRLAQSLLLTAFRDAPDDNVPCCREDGSYNMIARNGEGCGTAPEWCYPLWCVELAWRRTRDDSFLQAIYPLAEDYVNWWLKHRAGDDGRLHYLCSWESGQDCNPRFGQQATGGDLTTHVVPSDLQAAMAQSAALLGVWADRIGNPSDARRWRRTAARYRQLTRQLWNGDWFDDLDTSRDGPSDVRDTMQLAPVFCEVATAEQRRALAERFESIPGHGGAWSPLEWSPPALTAIESAWLLGRRDEAGRLAAKLVEHVYGVMDARQPAGQGPLPGVACEHWSATGGGWGAEGYGWGALTLMAVVRWIFGFREEPQGFTLSPSLPEEWLVPGRQYRIERLPIGLPAVEDRLEPLGATARVSIALTVAPDQSLQASATFSAAPGRAFTARPEGGGPPIATGRRRLAFSLTNRAAIHVAIG